MKNVIFTILSLFIGINAYADSWTMSCDPSTPAQFTDLQEAIDNASAGDTIYIYGDLTNGCYTNNPFVDIDKELHFVGEGLDTDFGFKYNMTGVGCSNSSFRGINGAIFFKKLSSVETISNLLIYNCRIGLQYELFNSSLESPVISNLQIIKSRIVSIDLIIESSSFFNSFFGYSIALGSTTSSIFKNCVINQIEVDYISGNSFDFVNCIFTSLQSTTFIDQNYDNCFFQEDISFVDQIDCESCIIGADPLFLGDDPFYHNTDLEDLKLATGSPCIGTGQGGTDMGITGGDFPFVDDFTLYPFIPKVTKLELSKNAVGQNSTIQFNSEAILQD